MLVAFLEEDSYNTKLSAILGKTKQWCSQLRVPEIEKELLKGNYHVYYSDTASTGQAVATIGNWAAAWAASTTSTGLTPPTTGPTTATAIAPARPVTVIVIHEDPKRGERTTVLELEAANRLEGLCSAVIHLQRITLATRKFAALLKLWESKTPSGGY